MWTGGLTKEEISLIERVQKTAFAIILGPQFKGYNDALVTLGMDTLEERRKSINLKFAKKSLKNDQFSHWFLHRTSNTHHMKTRSCGKKSLLPVQARTTRFENSPIAYLTQLLLNESKTTC